MSFLHHDASDMFPELLRNMATASLSSIRTFRYRKSLGNPRRGGRELFAAQNEDAYWNFVDSVHASQRELGTLEAGRDEPLDQLAENSFRMGTSA